MVLIDIKRYDLDLYLYHSPYLKATLYTTKCSLKLINLNDTLQYVSRKRSTSIAMYIKCDPVMYVFVC